MSEKALEADETAAAVEPLTSASDGPALAAAPAQYSAALSSQPGAHSQTVFIVETSIPLGGCQLQPCLACKVPCMSSLPVLPSTVTGQQLQVSKAIAPESLEDQKLAAEEVVAEALHKVFQGCQLHCFSSIEVASTTRCIWLQ